MLINSLKEIEKFNKKDLLIKKKIIHFNSGIDSLVEISIMYLKWISHYRIELNDYKNNIKSVTEWKTKNITISRVNKIIKKIYKGIKKEKQLKIF